MNRWQNAPKTHYQRKTSLCTITGLLFALLAALLFGLNAPASKLLVQQIHPLFLASLLYLGAGLGMLALGGLRRFAVFLEGCAAPQAGKGSVL